MNPVCGAAGLQGPRHPLGDVQFSDPPLHWGMVLSLFGVSDLLVSESYKPRQFTHSLTLVCPLGYLLGTPHLCTRQRSQGAPCSSQASEDCHLPSWLSCFDLFLLQLWGSCSCWAFGGDPNSSFFSQTGGRW